MTTEYVNFVKMLRPKAIVIVAFKGTTWLALGPYHLLCYGLSLGGSFVGLLFLLASIAYSQYSVLVQSVFVGGGEFARGQEPQSRRMETVPRPYHNQVGSSIICAPVATRAHGFPRFSHGSERRHRPSHSDPKQEGFTGGCDEVSEPAKAPVSKRTHQFPLWPC